MKVICCYRDLHPAAAAALEEHAPGAVMIPTPGTYDYNEALALHWGSGGDLVVVEEDKVITAEVLPSFDGCPEPWCVFAYETYPPPYTRPITIGLGCTRFSAQAQSWFGPDSFLGPDHPDWGTCGDCGGAGCWRFLDSRIGQNFWSRGISSHVHGWVEHLHQYPADWGETTGQYLEGGGPVEVRAAFRKVR